MGGSASTGANKIVKPGYHLKPKYDLHGLRRRRTDEHKGHVAGELPLVSLIDVFSTLVIYLLMNFSATGEVFFVNKDLALPKAAQTNAMQNGPLLSIVGEKFILDAPPAIDNGIKGLEDESPGLDNVINALRDLKAQAESVKLDTGNRINIQAGEDTSLGMVKRAMAASVTAGWTNINFVVEKQKGQ